MVAARAVELTRRTLYAPRRYRRRSANVIRAIIQYESEPDPARYQAHLDEFVPPVECRAFRHGRVFGSPFGEPAYRYYAEFEWDDMESFEAAVRSEAFAASGKDAMAMGIPFTVSFVSVE
jgi:hypothetical protein